MLFIPYRIPEDIAELDLSLEKPSRQDIHFVTHGGNHILWHLVESLRLANNKAKNIETVYTTMCLLLVELLTEETFVEFSAFILNLQVLSFVMLQIFSPDVYVEQGL